jgi:hypothetical protein
LQAAWFVGDSSPQKECKEIGMSKKISNESQIEVHGDHWTAALPNQENRSTEELLRWVCKEGSMAGEAGFDLRLNDGSTRPEKVYAIIHPDTPLRYLLLVMSDSSRGERKNEVASGYPYMDGCVNRVRVDEIKTWANGIEGVVHGTARGGAAVSFFDTDFYKNCGIYQPGKAYDFSVAALAYKLVKAEKDSITVTEGPMIKIEQERVLAKNPNADISKITSVELSLAEMRCLLCTNRIPDDAEFRTVVDEVGYFEVDGVGYYRIRGILMWPDDQKFEGYIYAAEDILKGYRPQKGDSIEGYLWLQGRLVAETAYDFESSP